MGKVSSFFSGIWLGLSIAGRIILGIILLAFIALVIFLIVRHKNKSSDDNSDSTNRPEVAQVYEPSIGSPLPADTPGENSDGNKKTTDNAGKVAGDSTNASSTMMMAPHTGIDPSEPVKYESTTLKFSALLPAGSDVKELSDGAAFTSAASGAMLYSVSVQSVGTETLQTIESQLRNSPGTENIILAEFAGKHALKFTNKSFGSGIAFIANGKIYYLLGNSRYFADFKVI